MFTRRKKTESNSDVRDPQNRLLRLFSSSDRLPVSPISLDNNDRDALSEDQKLNRNAMLEFEYQSAKARQALERNQRFY